ncbi:MAG: class I SAM-dependent methyltransferase [Granulosicoccaceae bacterium]|jgi:SAM-dependent methyltransferase
MIDWDVRYSEPGYAYGTRPNDFLREHATRLPGRRVLSLAEGEGRNAVFLAGQGYEVTAVDASPVAMRKTAMLAGQNGLAVHVHTADLADYDIEPGRWDGVVSIFCHVPPAVRATLHQQVVAGLRAGGVLLLEAYTPEQVGLGTGGPKDAGMTMTAQTLEQELDGLEILLLEETQREVIEGKYHTGTGAVVQCIARKV